MGITRSKVFFSMGYSIKLGNVVPSHPPINKPKVLIRSDGTAVACGRNQHGQCNIPALSAGTSYTQVSAGMEHTLLLLCNGEVVACGANGEGQYDIELGGGPVTCVQVSAGALHSVLLLSDGTAVAFGWNTSGQCTVPVCDSRFFTQVSAGACHTVFLRSDGIAVCTGMLEHFEGVQRAGLEIIVAGDGHTVGITKDGTAVCGGFNHDGQCNIPALPDGVTYSTFSRFSMASHTFSFEVLAINDHEVNVILTNLGGQERLRWRRFGHEEAFAIFMLISFNLKLPVQSLHLILPSGDLLHHCCGQQPGLTLDGLVERPRQTRRFTP